MNTSKTTRGPVATKSELADLATKAVATNRVALDAEGPGVLLDGSIVRSARIEAALKSALAAR